MAYSSPATVVTATTITSTWGNSVKSATDYLANPPACRAYHNTTQTAATATHQAMAFNSERFDTNTMHDTVTNNSRITINTAGLYVVTGAIEWASHASGGVGVRQLELRVNGATFIAINTVPGMASVGQPQAVASIYKFAATDYVELHAFQTTGVTLTVNSAANYSPELSAAWIGLG